MDKLSETAEENAEVFREFFEAQYSRKPSGNPSAADKLPQLSVFEEESRLPSRKEVRKAVRKLNVRGPDYTGNNAAAWKALLASERVFDWVEEYTCRFWQHQDPPADWKTNLLKILEKKGDLSLPKNYRYRGIMMLEVAYKVVANSMQCRLTKIAEALPHEAQCGFRPGRGGSDAKFNFLMALKKRREHGMETLRPPIYMRSANGQRAPYCHWPTQLHWQHSTGCWGSAPRAVFFKTHRRNIQRGQRPTKHVCSCDWEGSLAGKRAGGSLEDDRK
jgi:hypothetical protein